MNAIQYKYFQEHNFETLSSEIVKEILDELLTWF